MKSRRMLAVLVLALGLIVFSAKVFGQIPIGTSFTYQGWLMDDKKPADGYYDFKFNLYNDPNAGTQEGSTIDINDHDVTDGYFTVELDFGGGIFTGDARWLEIAVRRGASTDPCDFVTLSPRMEVTLTPYAIYAETAGVVLGGITGSGTANYVPKFTDANTFANSVIYESAGNVGIGTTEPTEKLEVNGNLKVTGNIIGGLKTYDSGWFAASTTGAYPKTHNLGTTKIITKLYWASDSSGSDMEEVSNSFYGVCDSGSYVADITATTFKVLTGSNLSGYIDGAGGYGNRKTGYLRVIAIAIE